MINVLKTKLFLSVNSCFILLEDFGGNKCINRNGKLLIYVLSISNIASNVYSSRQMRASTRFICATQYYIMKSNWNYKYFDDKYT